MVKVIHLTTVHEPGDVRIFIKMCSSIANAGYDISLIARNVPTAPLNGVKFINLRNPASRFQRMIFTSLELFFKAYLRKADIYHFHDPELIPIGLLLRLLGKKVIYDVHEELSNDIFDKEWINPKLRPIISRIISRFEKFASHFFNGIVISRPSLSKNFNPNKTVLVHNYPLKNELSSFDRLDYEKRPFSAAYVGGASPERGIKELIEALALLPDDFDFILYIAGNITPHTFYEEIKKHAGWKRVRYLGWQTRPQIANLLSNVRLGVVTFLPIANHLHSEPTKLFEYMSAGLPVVASNMPHWEKLISENGYGLLADPTSPKSISKSIMEILQNPSASKKMGLIAQKDVLDKYNWEHEFSKLITLYEGLT